MRLLHVLHYPDFGGPHNQALRLLGPLARRGWTQTVVIPHGAGDAAERLKSAGVDVMSMDLGRVRITTDLRVHLSTITGLKHSVGAIAALIRQTRADLVLLSGLINPHGALAARRARVPVVWQLVDSFPPALVRHSLRHVVEHLADAIMFDGPTVERLHGHSHAFCKPTFVYFPPVDVTRFVPSSSRSESARAALGIKADAPVVGMVANINPQKGIEYFVRACFLISQQREDAVFVLVGAEFHTHRRYAESLRAAIRGYGLDKSFRWLGPSASVELLYPCMDVKVITSRPRSEGTTTTALEAMACGVPVVATAVGGIADVVSNGETGLMVSPDQPSEIARTVLGLLATPHERQRMATQARLRAVQLFSAESCADVHVRAFNAALKVQGQHGPNVGPNVRG